MLNLDRKINVNFIDTGRRLFTINVGLSCKIRDIKEIIKDRVDDYDVSKFIIKLGDLYIDEDKPIAYYENLRNNFEMDGFNYRIEIIESNSDSGLTKFKFQFSDSEQRFFNFRLNEKISYIKQFLVKNGLPNCTNEDSIALFYKSKIELEDNISIKSVGIPKDEPIIVKSISYEYSIILPDGITLIFAMKKKSKVFDLKKKIIQVYTKEEIKITDFYLEVNGRILQNDCDLFYERIRKDQLILVVRKRASKNPDQNSISCEPRKTIKTKRSQRKNSVLYAKQNGTNEQFETFKFIRQNCDDKLISFKDVKDKMSCDLTVYGYITFDFQSNLISGELPFHCPISDAKIVLLETYFKNICSFIKTNMIKIKSNSGEKRELNDDEILELQSTSKNPMYSILLDINFSFKIKNLKIKKSFNFYPTTSQVFNTVKKELLKINPRYTEFRLFYQNKKIYSDSPFKVLPGATINVDIIEDASETAKVYFEIPNKLVFYLEFDEATPISAVCETIKKAHQIQEKVSLIYQGKILEKDGILLDLDLSMITKDNPVVVYVQHSLNFYMKMISE